MDDDSAQLMRFVLEMRQEGVTHARALSAMERTPRKHYAPGYLADAAMENMDLPIAHGQTMTKPSIIGRMLSALDAQDDDVVLEIGTGSGYQAAALAHMARKVVTLDRWRALVAIARAHIGTARLMHVYPYLGDGAQGWEADAPYDRIMINAAIDKIPDALKSQLKPGGTILAPIIDENGQRLMRFKDDTNDDAGEDLGPIAFAPIEHGIAGDPAPSPETNAATNDEPQS